MGKTLADGYLEIRPDLDRFGPNLRRAISAINFNQHGRDAGRRFGDGMSKGFGDSSSTFARVAALMAARAALATVAITALTPVIAKFAVAAAPAAGVVVALPAALAAATAASATFKLAVSGVSDAIQKGLYGTAKQYNEALENLPPAARDVARAVVGLKGELQSLRQSVAQRFFAPLVDDLKPLVKTYMPLLKTEMGGLAGKLGDFGSEVLRVARTSVVLQAVRDVFQSTGTNVDILRGAVAPLGTALAKLVSSTMPLLMGMSQGVVTLSQRFAAWVDQASQTGRLVTIWNSAVTTIKDLWAIFGNLFAIVRDVFSYSNTSSGTLLGNLRELTAQARRWVDSSQGARVLGDIFRQLAGFGETMRTTLAGVLPNIVESIRLGAPAASKLATALGDILVELSPLLPALTGITAELAIALIPALTSFAHWLHENSDLVRGLAPYVVGATAAIYAYRAAVVAAAIATKAWSASLAFVTGPIGIAVAAIGFMVWWTVHLWQTNENFRNQVTTVWKAVQTAIGAVSSWFTGTIVPSIKTAIGQAVAAWTWLRDTVAAIWAQIWLFIRIPWLGIQTIFLIMKSYVTVLIPAWFGLLVTFARNSFNTLGALVKSVWDSIRTGSFDPLRIFITQTLPGAFRTGVDAIKAAWNTVREAARQPVAFVVHSIINPLISGYNRIAELFGTKTVPAIGGFAQGGQVPGYATGGRIPGLPSTVDNRLAVGPRGPIKVATGEFIVNARDTAKALPLLSWVNDGMRGGARTIAHWLGKPLSDTPGDGSEGWAFARGGLIPGYAGGGLVGFLSDVWGAITNPSKLIAAPIEAAMRGIPGAGLIKDFVLGMGRKLIGGLTSFLTGQAGGTASGTAGAAQAFLRAQAGKPYIWASAGPNGYDCSGIVSAAWNILHGRSPYSHTFSTGQLPGSFFPKPGMGGVLTAGWSHPGQSPASSGTGHMAGQLLGLPFESRGSRGVVVGGGARRVTEFAHLGHFARGGRIPLMDWGGPWESGTVRANMSGHTEHVLTGGPNGDMAEIRDLLAAMLTVLRGLGGDVASALASNTARAVQLGRGRAPRALGQAT